MKTMVPDPADLSPQLSPYFDALAAFFGFVPNLARVLGYSPHVLRAFLELANHQDEGVFSAIERESILLAVSEYHGSPYCLSAHTAHAKRAGASEQATVSARHHDTGEAKLDFLIHFALTLVEQRGRVPRDLMDDFEEMGYDTRTLMDIVALVIESTFSNYVGLLTKLPPDFGAYEQITEA
jgi:AhpD family alkylhydroperoxidase